MTLLANKYLLGAVGLLLALAAIWGYGRFENSQGAQAARTQIEVGQMVRALDQQLEKDSADTLYRIRLQVSEASQKVLATKLSDSGRVLQSVRKQLQTAGAQCGLNDAGEDWIGILGASWAEYSDMAGEAARLADKVSGLQGYVRAIRRPVSD